MTESQEEYERVFKEMEEKDPNGIRPGDPGAKLDSGKIRYSLIPFKPLMWLAKLYTKGAEKYSPHGWKEVKNGEERYFDALLRHVEDYRHGKWLDDEEGGTGVPHLIAVAWNAFAIVYYREKDNKEE